MSDQIKLPPRQREVLQLLSLGKADKEIAAALNISVRTAKAYVKAVRKTLGGISRTEAAIWGRLNPEYVHVE